MKQKTLTITEKTYEGLCWYIKPAEYIHRYYLPLNVRKKLQPQDIKAIHGEMLGRYEHSETLRELEGSSIQIKWKEEGLLKTINPRLVKIAVNACSSYRQDIRSKSFTTDEISALLKLNETLAQLEKDIRRKLVELKNLFNKDRAKSAIFTTDCEIESVTEFYLKEYDPLFEDDDDNIIYTIKEHPVFRDNTDEIALCSTFLADGMDHNCWREYNDDNLVLSAPCCWFFHDIVEHSHVPLKHFARVGMIWTDIICRHQDRREEATWISKS